ncbi:MAG TPA: YciI family protein [Roseiflexaceae bacterium]|nr:YciI family protein [Roseiflexaceae bacterium]
MQYLLLAYQDERLLDALSANQRDALASACRDSDEMLRQSGHLVAAQSLHSNRDTATVRVCNGQLSVAEGPVAEIREQLVGVFCISARDLNEAIQVAATMPQARGGPIEVRPIIEPSSVIRSR